MGKFGEQLTVILTAIIGLATLSVILSQHAKTADVINSAGTQFSNMLKAAVGPVMN
jgi:hypothetical protein